MYNVEGLRSATEHRWNAVIRKLWQQLDQLTDSYCELARDLIPFEDGGHAATAAWRRTRESYEHLLRELMGVPAPELTRAVARQVAVAWVTEELALDVLMHATNLMFKALWSALLWNTSKADLPMLAVNSERVWSVVQSFSSEVQAAYIGESAAIESARLDAERRQLSRLLSGEDLSPQQLSAVSATLGTALDGTYAVCLGRQNEREALHRAAAGLQGAGGRALVHDDGEHVFILVDVSGEAPELKDALAGTPCAIAPFAHGLAQVPSRAALGRRISGVLENEQGPAQLMDVWDRLVGLDVEAWEATLRDEVLGGLRNRTAYETERIVETVAEYLRCGSVTDVAAGLYCHRNTVLNRLREFRRVSGFDVTIPREAAAVVIALACEERHTSVRTALGSGAPG